ncbi:MAG: hypothetical protein K1X66_07415 [Verrucomicrobiae bacterium]|nr:hypothetical protein [Verrucomicrobiae bacterium]
MKKILLLIVVSVLFVKSTQAQIFITQQQDIAIPDNTNAVPYPSVITVSNLPTKLIQIEVSFTLTHTFPDDVDILLVGPEGQSTILMSDCGGSGNITNAPFIITDFTTNSIPDSTSIALGGRFKPTNFPGNDGTNDVWPSPAPTAPYGTNLAVFTNTNPNGDWKLFVKDDQGVDSGLISQWTLNLSIYPENDYNGDSFSDYVLKKKKNIYVVNETNIVSISKSTTPNATIKSKIVAGADLDGDHISDLITKKGKTVQGLKGPGFTTPIHNLQVKGLKPVASGDFNGDLVPDLYFQKKTSLFVAINTGSGFEAPKVVADKKLPKKFKIFGALSGRLQPTVLAQKGTEIVSLSGPDFNTLNKIITLNSKKAKAGAVGQFVFDGSGATILIGEKKTLFLQSPFAPGIVAPFVTNAVKGVKLIAPR